MLVWKNGKLEKQEYVLNPEAKKLADRYAPLIIAMLRGSAEADLSPDSSLKETPKEPAQHSTEERHPSGRAFQETAKDWELAEEDLAALEELPF
jgi:hypothetical protein